jgi:hypothetical protein
MPKLGKADVRCPKLPKRGIFKVRTNRIFHFWAVSYLSLASSTNIEDAIALTSFGRINVRRIPVRSSQGGPWRPSRSPPSNGVGCFNNHRLLEPIGHITTAEAEANHYALLDTIQMAA